MTDVCVGLKDLLEAQSVGVFASTSDWGIYIGDIPDEPHNCLVIRQTGGRNSNPRYLLDFPSVQVMIRGTKNGYVAASGKAKNVKDVLIGLPSQDLNGDRWVAINAIGDIMFAGKDDNDRPMFTLNLALIIEPATSALTNREPL